MKTVSSSQLDKFLSENSSVQNPSVPEDSISTPDLSSGTGALSKVNRELSSVRETTANAGSIVRDVSSLVKNVAELFENVKETFIDGANRKESRINESLKSKTKNPYAKLLSNGGYGYDVRKAERESIKKNIESAVLDGRATVEVFNPEATSEIVNLWIKQSFKEWLKANEKLSLKEVVELWQKEEVQLKKVLVQLLKKGNTDGRSARIVNSPTVQSTPPENNSNTT